jgi:hypothetical protein
MAKTEKEPVKEYGKKEQQSAVAQYNNQDWLFDE